MSDMEDGKLIATQLDAELHKKWSHLCIELGVSSKSLLRQLVKDRLRLEEHKIERAANAEKTGRVEGGRKRGK